MYDMVQLNDQTVAVITKVEVASFRVITQRGVSYDSPPAGDRPAPQQQVRRCPGRRQQPGGPKDDVVTVNSGEHRGKQGTIKHIYRYFLFLYLTLSTPTTPAYSSCPPSRSLS